MREDLKGGRLCKCSGRNIGPGFAKKLLMRKGAGAAMGREGLWERINEKEHENSKDLLPKPFGARCKEGSLR